MWRFVGALALLVVGTCAGAWLPALIAGATAEGPDVRCIYGGRICTGQRYEEALNVYNLDRELGGVISITCGFELPGSSAAANPSLFLSTIPRGCPSPRFVVILNDGNVQTNFWVDQGRIVRIDRYSAHPLAW